ncbi:MAG TPA: hypothetical protein VD948_08675 [Rhodothermales bacterium]|nr:hypothetical protein [Rhodothermales bacterium]
MYLKAGLALKKAIEALSNLTLTQPTLVLKQSAAPAPTAEGDIQWDTDDNVIKVGDGAATQIIPSGGTDGNTHAGDWKPDGDGTRDGGSSSARWRDWWLTRLLRLTGGGTPYAASVAAAGGIHLNNGTADGPGVVFVTAANQNVALNPEAGGLRITKDLGEATGAVLGKIFRSGGFYLGASPSDPGANNLQVQGLITGANFQVNAGQYRWNEAGVRSWTAAASGGTLNIASGDGSGRVVVTDPISVGTAAPASPAVNTLYKDSIPKAWAKWSLSGGTVTLDDDVNVSSITDNGVGDFTLNWATAFSSAHYAVAGTAGAAGQTTIVPVTVATGSIRVQTLDPSGVAQDRTYNSLIAIGDN